MATSHNVDLLSSGFVIKTASSEAYNEKLKAEIEQINALHEIYPELMVPVLHDGSAAGRHFYILEKMAGRPLSKIIFDNSQPIEHRRSVVRAALSKIRQAIEIERAGQMPPVDDMLSRLIDEWKAIGIYHDLFDRQILLDGEPLRNAGRRTFEKACTIVRSASFVSVERAHLNFHFGNVLYDEATEQVNFIDPDYSVRGIDPLFGLSRFVFSFWHELATEIADAVKIVPMSNSVLFVIRNDEHRRILEGIPELRGMSGLFGWLDPAEIPKFYALTVYCFLRSMRINGTGRPWVAPEHPMAARPEDVLLLGCLLFLEGFQTRSG
ncbi:aminoglycoside phosphotransferase family protein [Rubrivivax sp. JA1024]|nr:aminoglycoside phosphotransferase family protein [Rubrivivax sp. JA1024]